MVDPSAAGAFEPEEEQARQRFEHLVAAGFGWRDAVQLALREDVDVDLAVALVTEGCPVATAIRIVV